MKTTDIYENIADYKSKIRAEDRYTSFDYCYNYFRTVQGNSLTDDIEKSCLTLGFYLASWGMFRGSSFLIDKSAKHFEPTVRYVAKLDRSIWLIDVDSYEQNNIMTIIQIYNDIKNLIITGNNSDLTLITKIMLGVFGFIPAFDKYFGDAFRKLFKDEKCGFSSINFRSLNCIKSFYDSNKVAINKISTTTFTSDFKSGEKTTINYPKAKIIDMYGFVVGMKMNKLSKGIKKLERN